MEGRKGASRRSRRSSRGRHTRTRAVLTGIFVTFLVLFVGAIVVAAVGASNYYDGLTHLDELQQVPQGQNSAIYARDGSRLTVIASDKNRRYVSLDRISKWLPAATIAIEDRRFYEHHGVDWKAVGRAAVKNLEAGRVAEGGSTLTQQLVRNIYPQITNEVTLKRKLNEALVARELEDQHPKQWILEQYLNTVPYGHSAYGAEAAAQIYFSRSAKDLTMAQAALLAGLPQGPSRYDPFVHAQGGEGPARRGAAGDARPGRDLPGRVRAGVGLQARAEARRPVRPHHRAVRRAVRAVAARERHRVRRPGGARRRPQGDHDDRSADAEAGVQRHAQRAQAAAVLGRAESLLRPGRGARLDPALDGGDRRDDVHLQVQEHAVQLRAGPAAAGLDLQAVHARRRDRGRHQPGHDLLPVGAVHDRQDRPVGPDLRPLEGAHRRVRLQGPHLARARRRWPPTTPSTRS